MVKVQCRKCGRDESLSDLFIDGACAECLRTEAGIAPPKRVAFQAVVPRPSQSGFPTFAATKKAIAAAVCGFEIILGTVIWNYYWFWFDPTIADRDGDRIYHIGRQQYQLMGFLFGLFLVMMGHLTLLLKRDRD